MPSPPGSSSSSLRAPPSPRSSCSCRCSSSSPSAGCRSSSRRASCWDGCRRRVPRRGHPARTARPHRSLASPGHGDHPHRGVCPRLPDRVRARSGRRRPHAARARADALPRPHRLGAARRRGGLPAGTAVGGGFLAAAIPLALLVPTGRSPHPVTVIILIGAYALASRIEFELAPGAAVPTQLVLVPMLFLVPIGWVPLVVAAGFLLGRLSAEGSSPRPSRSHCSSPPVARLTRSR